LSIHVMTSEQQIIQIITHGGNARSPCLKAVEKGQSNEWKEVEALFEQADESLTKAHQIQTKLIQAEIKGEEVDISLYMIHAQEHLMNALTVRDIYKALVEEIKMRKSDKERKIK